jgi:hypothetical protein
MTWKMYLFMLAFLTVMLTVFFIVAWSVLVNVAQQYRGSRGRLFDEDEPGIAKNAVIRRLPLWKALPLALATAWIIVHFIVRN